MFFCCFSLSPGGGIIGGGRGNERPAPSTVSHDPGRAGLRLQPALQKVPPGSVHPLGGPQLSSGARGTEAERPAHRGDRKGLHEP